MPVILFAYFGPETMLPLTSVVATVVGVFLMLGRNTFRLMRRALLGWIPGIERKRSIPRPHLSLKERRRRPIEAVRR